MAIVLIADSCMDWIVTGLRLSGSQVTRHAWHERASCSWQSRDLLIVDLAQPEPDEREIIAAFTASGRPVILLCDREREDVAGYGLPYLVKPVAFRALLHLVEQCLACVSFIN